MTRPRSTFGFDRRHIRDARAHDPAAGALVRCRTLRGRRTRHTRGGKGVTERAPDAPSPGCERVADSQWCRASAPQLVHGWRLPATHSPHGPTHAASSQAAHDAKSAGLTRLGPRTMSARYQNAMGAHRQGRAGLLDVANLSAGAAPATITIAEAAELLRISRSTAYALAHRWLAGDPNGLPVVRVGRSLRVPGHAMRRALAVSDEESHASRPIVPATIRIRQHGSATPGRASHP